MVNSELGYLYYVSMGNQGSVSTGGTNQFLEDGLENTGGFLNLSEDIYWSDTVYFDTSQHDAWRFHFGRGDQDISAQGNGFYALAVRPGEVSAVPIPGALLLMASGLAGLLVSRGRRDPS